MTNVSQAAHTVAFFQTAFTIVLAMALGEALKQFVSDEDHRPLRWDRLPSFVSFILFILPFFQGMGQHMFSTYLDPATAPPYRQAYLMFDGLMFLIQSAILYVMARAIPPRMWRRFYGSALLLLAVDMVWTGVTLARGIHVGLWAALDVALALALLTILWWERHKDETLRPAIICAVLTAISTTLSYGVMTDLYFSK